MNVVSLVREIRNRPALDSTRAAPPTLASGVPVTVTVTREFANWLGTTLSGEAAGPLGDVGDEPSPPQRGDERGECGAGRGLAGAGAELAS